MNAPTTEKRRQWWLLCYAYTSMKKAICGCQLIEKLCSDNRHPLFAPLTVAIHTYYARTFKKSKGVGSLPDDMIPSDRIGIHRWLEHFRDSVLSHTDANHAEVANRPMHDLVYSVDGDSLEFSTSDPLPNIDAYRDVEAHCASMAMIFLTKIIELQKKYHDFMPSINGDFLMTLDDSLDLFIPHTLPEQGTLNYP
jgi:hypothetical protein